MNQKKRGQIRSSGIKKIKLNRIKGQQTLKNLKDENI